jgi:hypothetical protein
LIIRQSRCSQAILATIHLCDCADFKEQKKASVGPRAHCPSVSKPKLSLFSAHLHAAVGGVLSQLEALVLQLLEHSRGDVLCQERVMVGRAGAAERVRVVRAVHITVELRLLTLRRDVVGEAGVTHEMVVIRARGHGTAKDAVEYGQLIVQADDALGRPCHLLHLLQPLRHRLGCRANGGGLGHCRRVRCHSGHQRVVQLPMSPQCASVHAFVWEGDEIALPSTPIRTFFSWLSSSRLSASA